MRQLRSTRAIASLCAALALASCGGKLPEVRAVDWRVESRPNEDGSRFESLSVFASIKDEDGLENIEEVWVVNDDSTFAWKLTSADWTKASEGADNWIGGSSLATPDLSPLPRGKYRLVAVDAAGQRAEQGFAISGVFPDKKAPSLAYSAGTSKLTVRSDWPECIVLAFDSAGTLLRSAAAPAKEASLVELFGQGAADRVALLGAYGYEPQTKMGAFSPRIKTR